MSIWSKTPGPKSRALTRRLRRVESRNVTYRSNDFPVFWESAQGSQVVDADGRRYLDLTSAFGVSSLGHRSRAVRQALLRQSKKMWHGMGDVHPNAVKVELLEHLARLAPGRLSVSILSSSGAESIESALKTARLATGKPGVIAFDGAYHGLTYGTLAVADRKDFTAPFADQIPGIAVHLPFPDSLRGPSEENCLEWVEAFIKKHRAKIGAILVEPVQGRGGVRVPKAFFLKGLRAIAARFDLLLIADEIFTGFGRTGRMFAVEHSGVAPDLMCVGKALANGFPISACMGTPDVMAAWPVSGGEAIHTSTFLGNPLGCAMGVASLAELEKKKLVEYSASLGTWWKKKLGEALGSHPHVGDVRGLGLMLGIELVTNKRSLEPDPRRAAQVVTHCLHKGLIILSGGKARNVLTLTPSLTISKADLEKATHLLKQVIDGTHSSKN